MPLKIKAKLKLCKRFVLHPLFLSISVTLCYSSFYLIFPLILLYTLRFVPFNWSRRLSAIWSHSFNFLRGFLFWATPGVSIIIKNTTTRNDAFNIIPDSVFIFLCLSKFLVMRNLSFYFTL